MKPVKLLLGVLLPCLLASQLSAQAPDTSTTEKLIRYVLQPLNKSQVPTGFLEEWGAPIVPMATFNGALTDSNKIDMNLWRTLYFQLETSYCQGGTNPLPPIASVNGVLKQNTQSTLPTPIPLLIAQYNNVKSDAFANNLLGYNTGTNQVFDVAGRPQLPYQGNNLFAACPNKQFTATGTASFVCKQDLLWNTSGKTISSVQVDFDNSLGFQTLTLGTPITVSYADTGTKRWTIKVTFTDNSVMQCYSSYYVLKAATGNSAARYNPNTFDETWFIPATTTHPAGRVRIRYSRRGTTLTLRKPLLVVEGYDVHNVAPALQPDNYSYTTFVNSITFEPVGYDFNGQLDDIVGYDLLFVDFDEGTADIRNNAASVEDIISNWVNTNKVFDNRSGRREQNVVMGLSMGGLVARYALAEMTKANQATETRLLITHDSPHRGANVPLGLQYLIRMVGQASWFGRTIRAVYPEYDEAINLLDEPATQQLLLYRSTGTNSFATNAFLGGDYRNMITFAPTDPQPTYRFVATSLGSECAHPVFQPYTKLLDANVDAFVFFFPLVNYRVHTIAESYALPLTGNTCKIARFKFSSKFKLFGFITINKDEYDNTAYAPGTHLAVDGVPGSTNPFAFPVAEIHTGFGFIRNLWGFWGYASVNVSGTPDRFTFVPAASALDVSPYNASAITQPYVNGSNPSYPSASETFIAQETNNAAGTTNNTHIRFTARNSQWLFNEMENLNNALNCSNECFNPYYIAGENTVCSTSTNYSIPGLPRGATVTWSTFPAGIANLSCTTCASTTLTRNSSGTITLTATITGACGGNPTLTKPNIRVGPPAGIGIVSYSTLGNCDGDSYFQVLSSNPPGFYPYSGTLTVAELSGVAPNITWSLAPYSSNNFWAWSASNNTVTVNTKRSNVSITLRATARNSCGTVYKDYNFSTGNCSIVAVASAGEENIKFSIGPNPVANMFTATLKNASNSVASIEEIVIKDKLGTVKKHLKFKSNSKSQTVDVQDLPTDVYVVQVFDGKEWCNGKLIKQ